MKAGKPGSEKVDELRQHPSFKDVDWMAISSGKALSPAKAFCAQKLVDLEEDTAVVREIDTLFNEVYIPTDETKDEFEGVSNSFNSFTTKGPKTFGRLVMDAAATKKKVKDLKRQRVARYERLKGKRMLRGSVAGGFKNMRNSVASKLRMSTVSAVEEVRVPHLLPLTPHSSPSASPSASPSPSTTPSPLPSLSPFTLTAHASPLLLMPHPDASYSTPHTHPHPSFLTLTPTLVSHLYLSFASTPLPLPRRMMRTTRTTRTTNCKGC